MISLLILIAYVIASIEAKCIDRDESTTLCSDITTDWLKDNRLPRRREIIIQNSTLSSLTKGIFRVNGAITESLTIDGCKVERLEPRWISYRTPQKFLSFKNNLLRDVPAQSVTRFVQVLDLSYNQIDTFYPEDINVLQSKAPYIERLTLHGNQIQSVNLSTITLKALDLSNNQVNVITLGDSQIDELDLRYNRLDSLSDDTFVNSTFIVLKLSGNPLRSISPRSLSSMPRLENLFMSDLKRLNKATKKHFPLQLVELPNLASVDLTQNQFWCSCSLSILDERFNMTCRHRGGWRQQISIPDYLETECYEEGSGIEEHIKIEITTFKPETRQQSLSFDVSIDNREKDDIFAPRSTDLVVFDTSVFEEEKLAIDSDDEIGSGTWIDYFIDDQKTRTPVLTSTITTKPTTVTTTMPLLSPTNQISDDDFFSLVEMLEINIEAEETTVSSEAITTNLLTTPRSLLNLIEQIKNTQQTQPRPIIPTALVTTSTTTKNSVKTSQRPSLLELIQSLDQEERTTSKTTTDLVSTPNEQATTTKFFTTQIATTTETTGETTTNVSTHEQETTTTTYTTSSTTTYTKNKKEPTGGRSVVSHSLFSIVQRNAIARPTSTTTTKMTTTVRSPVTTPKTKLTRKEKLELKKKHKAEMMVARRERKQKMALAAKERRDRRIQAEKDKRVFDLLKRNQVKLNENKMKKIRTDAKKVQQERKMELAQFASTLRRLDDLEARRIIHSVNEAKRKAAEEAENEREFWLMIEELEKTTTTITTTTTTTTTTSTTSTTTSTITTTSTVPSVTITDIDHYNIYEDTTTLSTTTTWSTTTTATTSTRINKYVTPTLWRANSTRTTKATTTTKRTNKATTRQSTTQSTLRKRTTTTTQSTTKPFNYYVTGADGNLDYNAIIRHISNNNQECTQFGTVIQNAIRNKGKINIRVFNHYVDYCNAKPYRAPVQNYLETLGVTFVIGSIKPKSTTTSKMTTTTSTSIKTFAQKDETEVNTTTTLLQTSSTEKKVKVGRPRTTKAMSTTSTTTLSKTTTTTTTTTTELVIQVTLHTKLLKPTTTRISRRSGAPPTEVTPWSFTESTRYTKKPKSNISGKLFFERIRTNPNMLFRTEYR